MDINKGFKNLKIKHYSKIFLWSFATLCLMVSICLTNSVLLKLFIISLIIFNTVILTKIAIDLRYIYKTQREFQNLVVETSKKGDMDERF